MARSQQRLDLPHGVQGAVLGAIRVLFGLQVRLEDRLQHQDSRHLDHAILDARIPSGRNLPG